MPICLCKKVLISQKVHYARINKGNVSGIAPTIGIILSKGPPVDIAPFKLDLSKDDALIPLLEEGHI